MCWKLAQEDRNATSGKPTLGSPTKMLRNVLETCSRRQECHIWKTHFGLPYHNVDKCVINLLKNAGMPHLENPLGSPKKMLETCSRRQECHMWKTHFGLQIWKTHFGLPYQNVEKCVGNLLKKTGMPHLENPLWAPLHNVEKCVGNLLKKTGMPHLENPLWAPLPKC